MNLQNLKSLAFGTSLFLGSADTGEAQQWGDSFVVPLPTNAPFIIEQLPLPLTRYPSGGFVAPASADVSYQSPLTVLTFPAPQTVVSATHIVSPITVAPPVVEQEFVYQGPESLRAEALQVAKKALNDSFGMWIGHPVQLPPITISFKELPAGIGGYARIYPDKTGIVPPTIEITPRVPTWPNVLRHEIGHLVFHTACAIKPPRWADEGSAVCAELRTQREAYKQNLVTNYLRTGKGIPFAAMLTSREQTTGPDDDPFYAQAASTVEYLLEISPGRTDLEKCKYFVAFVRAVALAGSDAAAHREYLSLYYNFDNLGAFQTNWLSAIAQEENNKQGEFRYRDSFR